jgi:hypothetical protein
VDTGADHRRGAAADRGGTTAMTPRGANGNKPFRAPSTLIEVRYNGINYSL